MWAFFKKLLGFSTENYHVMEHTEGDGEFKLRTMF